MVSLRVLIYFFSSFFHYLFSIHSSERISFQSLTGKSFRVPEKDNHSFRFVFFILKDTLKKISSASIIKQTKISSGESIYDLHPQYFDLRKNYINSFKSESKISTGFFKDQLLSSYYNRSEKMGDIILFVFVYVVLFPFALLSKKRSSIMLIPKELVESSQLIRGVRKKNISVVYFFCIYEKDSNFVGLLLNKFGIENYKITSEVPLAVWNRRIVADHLCICFAYQYEELEAFKSTMFYKDVFLWGPERSHIVKQIYDNGELIQNELDKSYGTIGFYSTGGWIRKKLGHLEQETNIIENELLVLKVLIKYCAEFNKKLFVFLHPREKSIEYFEEAKQHYNNLLGEINYEIANESLNTSSLFHKVNVAVSFTSTVVFERIYFGFKTVVMPIGFTDFPLPGSSFSKISANGSDELFNKIKLAMQQNNHEFFLINKLNGYTKYKWN